MYVYFIRCKSNPPMVKIGKAKDPDGRMEYLQTGCPFNLKLLGSLPCRSEEHSREIEKALHNMFRRDHHRGEWFKYVNNVPRIIAAILTKLPRVTELEILKVFHEALKDPIEWSKPKRAGIHDAIDNESLSHLRSIRAEGRA
jgi:hypothetical protein